MTRTRTVVAALLAPMLASPWLATAPADAASSPSAAKPNAGTYTASAHGDLLAIDALNLLPAFLPGGGSLAAAAVGHSRSTANSAAASGRAVAESANLDASLVFGSTPVSVDSRRASAPEGPGTAAGTLLSPPLSPIAALGAISGDVVAADGNPCVAPVAGRRTVAHGTTALAASTVAESTIPGVPYLAQVGASRVETATSLVDNQGGTSDVEATTTANLGDISLLGGAAVVKVSSPVVLQARSDGTKGTAGIVSPPTVTANVGGQPIAIPLNGQPVNVPVGLPAGTGLDAALQVTAFAPTDQSNGAKGAAELKELVKVSLSVNLAGVQVASVDLGTAPMSVAAQASKGGIDCGDKSTNDTDTDGDGLSAAQEQALGTNPNNPDTDGDGLKDGAEVNTFKTDPRDADTDDGGVSDGLEVGNGTNPLVGSDDSAPAGDADGDGLSAGQEQAAGTNPNNPDTDGDGLQDGAEVNTFKTDPTKADTDNGGVQDGAEVGAGTDPLVGADDVPPVGDTDGDGLNLAQEQQAGTDPNNADTDGDGLSDGAEVAVGSNPLDSDSDNGGVSDGLEVGMGTNPAMAGDDSVVPGDSDGDGLNDAAEQAAGTNPAVKDTDGDGLSDGAEVNTLKTSPVKADTDGDGLSDGVEVNGIADTSCRPNPRSADTDKDKLRDGKEVLGFKIKQKVKVQKGKPVSIGRVRTSACLADTDGDKLKDGKEAKGKRVTLKVTTAKGTLVLKRLVSNPTLADTDRDGLSDKAEVSGSKNKKHGRHKSDPANYDTDGGKISDGREVKFGSDPSNAFSAPKRKDHKSGQLG